MITVMNKRLMIQAFCRIAVNPEGRKWKTKSDAYEHQGKGQGTADSYLVLRFRFIKWWNMFQLHPLKSWIYNHMEAIIKRWMQEISNMLETLCFINLPVDSPRGQVYRCVHGCAEIIAERFGVYASYVSFIFCWRLRGVYYPITQR